MVIWCYFSLNFANLRSNFVYTHFIPSVKAALYTIRNNIFFYFLIAKIDKLVLIQLSVIYCTFLHESVAPSRWWNRIS